MYNPVDYGNRCVIVVHRHPPDYQLLLWGGVCREEKGGEPEIITINEDD